MERYCFDTSVLAHFYDGRPSGNDDIPNKRERLKHFFSECDQQGHEVLIPTPVLAEFLIGVEGGFDEILAALKRSKSVQIVPFDEIAAIECSLIFPEQKRIFAEEDTKARLKFDAQILAICAARSVGTLITNDEGLARKAALQSIETLHLRDLPIPDDARQTSMFPEE